MVCVYRDNKEGVTYTKRRRVFRIECLCFVFCWVSWAGDCLVTTQHNVNLNLNLFSLMGLTTLATFGTYENIINYSSRYMYIWKAGQLYDAGYFRLKLFFECNTGSNLKIWHGSRLWRRFEYNWIGINVYTHWNLITTKSRELFCFV